jgi:pimeloyl-ACP methyl ester carboxylesterase
MRSLQYTDLLPVFLAQLGYTVVAPDYAGLGVGRSWDGSEIPHQLFAAPSGARDTVYAQQAARAAFGSRLGARFAVMGHSQGGGVSWATAEFVASLQEKLETLSQELRDTVNGYLGTVSMAPVTNPFTSLQGDGFPILAGINIGSIFPDFSIDQWLTPLGLARLELLRELQGSFTVALQALFLTDPIEAFLKPEWYNDSYHAQAFEKLATVGDKRFAGPMLVLQGTHDAFVRESFTSDAVEAACAMDPDQSLEYVVVDGYGHTPLVDALKPIWLQWLEERFSGAQAEAGCSRTDLPSVEGSFQISGYYPQWAGAPEYMWMATSTV